MISLPQSKPEMSDWDLRWQDLISKEVGRVAKQLIVNDESEISEVVRRASSRTSAATVFAKGLPRHTLIGPLSAAPSCRLNGWL
jgi:hypothetical protein